MRVIYSCAPVVYAFPPSIYLRLQHPGNTANIGIIMFFC